MFENRKNKSGQTNGGIASAASIEKGRLPLLRKGFLAFAVAAVVSGCAQVPYGGMFSDDRQDRQQSDVLPSLEIKKDIDLVRLSGVVSNNVEAAMIRLRAASIYGQEMLIDDIAIDERVGEAEWYSAVLDTAETMRDVEQFAISAKNGHVKLDGYMQSQADASALTASAAVALGQQLIVSDNLDYPGRETDNQSIAAVTLLPREESDSSLSTAQQAEADQQLSARSIPSPAVAGTIPLPVTTSAVVLEQAASLKQGEDLFVPQADAGVVQPAGRGITANDSDGDGIVNSMDECNSRSGYPVNAKGCQALDGMLKNVRFQGDTNNLTREAKASLDNVARVMTEYPAARIAILSYTSDLGTPLEARGQARNRARSVVGYLINKGVESTRLEAYAFGHINNSDDHIMIKEVD